ncbi:molybdenum cofactor sulfurase [Nocardiopsis sp. CNR-923]|uniref:MOSC domain-containing protein n=1 Tax=Nocardiopsis sp. CNR-923 TaxID=1904965 RepID=UPI000966DB38|nr:MOSC N-terminal beta barrel domain-containing protein [Nocardiopsis sp. CNR-923]OLT29735.1 molybdenum cofactor sulfurase [Nocardiopsis sp. CNR-923]
MARITELVHYPVKGCAGTAVTSARMTPAGIAHDRAFMVVGPGGAFRSQRVDPRMALVRAGVDAGGASLSLSRDGLEPLNLKIDAEGPRVDVTLHKQPFVGVDQGDEAAAWLSEALGSDSRLVRVPDDHDRRTGGLTPGTSGFADSTAVLVASLASLDLLNERVLARGGEAVPMNRFRPNVVVSGWSEPHTEDRVRTVRLGDAELGYAKVCVRCAVTTVAQERGEKGGPEPLRTLAGYRRADSGGVAFGAKFAVTRPGTLSVGDQVDVTAWGDREEGLGERLAAALT